MRIKFGNKIIEADCIYNSGIGDRFIHIVSHITNTHYVIDCEEIKYAKWLMMQLLIEGYFNASGVDYDNCNDPIWFKYCKNKTEEQKVFGKWINKT